MDPYDIYIVGIGILSSLHVTRETEQTLRLLKRIYFLHPERKWVRKYLETFSNTVVDLDHCYQEGAPRASAHRRIIDAVISGAEKEKPVGLAVYGHPRLLVTPTAAILNEACLSGWLTKCASAECDRPRSQLDLKESRVAAPEDGRTPQNWQATR